MTLKALPSGKHAMLSHSTPARVGPYISPLAPPLKRLLSRVAPHPWRTSTGPGERWAARSSRAGAIPPSIRVMPIGTGIPDQTGRTGT